MKIKTPPKIELKINLKIFHNFILKIIPNNVNDNMHPKIIIKLFVSKIITPFLIGMFNLGQILHLTCSYF